MRYLLLLRGINVGGKNKVAMKDLKQRISELSYRNVDTYLNSGNVRFDTDDDYQTVLANIADMLTLFSFPIRHVIMTKEEFLAEAAQLPKWWNEPIARRDVLFYTDEVDPDDMKDRINAMPLGDEIVYFGKRAVFWGKYSEKEYLRTAYHKFLIKEPFYPLITIRNGRTFEKLKELLG